MAVAVKQQVEKKTRPVRKRRQGGFRPKTGLIAGVVIAALVALVGYVGLYAKITQNGFYRAKLSSDLRAAKMQNQYLRADLQMLSCPDRLAAAATDAKMVLGENVQYVRVAGPVRVARAESDDR